MRVDLPIVGPAYEARIPELSVSECENFYVETAGAEGKTSSCLVATPSQAVFVTDAGNTVGDGPIFGVHETTVAGNEYPSVFVLSGVELYEIINVSGVETQYLRATLDRLWNSPVFMDDNGLQLVIVGTRPPNSDSSDNPQAWCLDLRTHQLVNLTSYTYLAFTSGDDEPAVGQTIQGATSNALATVVSVQVTSGSWDANNAAGNLIVNMVSGTFQAENVSIQSRSIAKAGGAAGTTFTLVQLLSSMTIAANPGDTMTEYTPAGAATGNTCKFYKRMSALTPNYMYLFYDFTAPFTDGNHVRHGTNFYSEVHITDASVGTYYDLAFTEGTTEPALAGIVGGTSGGTGTVAAILLESGDWHSGTAAGKLLLSAIGGAPFQAGETINGASTSAALVSSGAQATGSIPFAPSWVAVMGSRFLMGEENSGKWWYSDLLEGMSWPALNFYTAEAATDNLRRGVVVDDVLWLLGESSSEVWVKTTDANDPFAAVPGAATEYGIAGRFCVAKAKGALFWLSGDLPSLKVVQTSGYTVSVVGDSTGKSNPALEYQLNRFRKHDTDWSMPCYAYSYHLEGHTHVVFTFVQPEAQEVNYFASVDNGATVCEKELSQGTLVYDVTTGMWRTETQGPENSVATRSFPTMAVQYRGMILAAGSFDYATATTYGGGNTVTPAASPYLNQLLQVSKTYDPEHTLAVIRTRITRHLEQQGRTLFFDRLTLDVVVGATPVLDAESNEVVHPTLSFSWSDDAGTTWSTPRVADLGDQANRRIRVFFTDLGSSRDRVFKFTTNAAAGFAIFGAWLDVEVEDD